MTRRRKIVVLYALSALFGTVSLSLATASPFDDVIKSCAIQSYSEEAATRTLEAAGWKRIDPREHEWVIAAITDGDWAEIMSWKTYEDPVQERARLLAEVKSGLAKYRPGQANFLAMGDSSEALAIIWNPKVREQGLSCLLYAQRSNESDRMANELADIGGSSSGNFSFKVWKWFEEPEGLFRNIEIHISTLNQDKYAERFGVSPSATLKVMVIRQPKGNDT